MQEGRKEKEKKVCDVTPIYSICATRGYVERTLTRSIIGIGTEPVPLVRGLLTTRYVRGIGTRTDRGWVDGVDGKRTGRGEETGEG